MITKVALRTPNGEIHSLDKPNRHHNVIWRMHDLNISQEDINNSEQGFIDIEGNFINRFEAKELAVRVGQVTEKDLIAPPFLYSEDLW